MFSFITHVRDQPAITKIHCEAWSPISRHVAEFVLIDDYSQEPVRLPPELRRQGRLARSLSPQCWNYGVKNLGAAIATYDWLLFTNADHVLPTPAIFSLAEFVRDRAHPNRVYRFDRRNSQAAADSTYNAKRHIGTLLIHRETFDIIGGYEEDFSGEYGYDDTFMRDCLQHHGFIEDRGPVVMENYSGRTDIPDADFLNRPEWPRDLTRNTAILARKREEGQFRASQPLVRFPWRLTENL